MAITYVGAWRAGMDAHFLWQNADWNSFTAKWNELSGQNLRLARITTFGDGAQRRWVTDAATGPCVRYSVAWKDGRPQYR
jgi:hypothetical protein